MNKKPILLLSIIIMVVLVMVSFGASGYLTAYAEASLNKDDINKANNELPQILVHEKYYSQTETSGGLLFLLSSAKMSGEHKGYVISLFSNMEVDANFQGDIYSFFSDIKINGNEKDEIKIYNFSSNVLADLLETSVVQIKPISPILDYFAREIVTESSITYSDYIPNYMISLIIGFLNIIICCLIYAVKKSFVYQGGVLVAREPMNVINTGIISYGIFVGLIVVSAITVIFIPVSLLLYMIVYLYILIGEVSLATFMGFYIFDATGLRTESFIYMIVGCLIIELFKAIPYLGLGLSFLFLPILTLGIGGTNIMNAFIRKKYYRTPFENDIAFNEDINYNQDVKDIILRNKGEKH